MLAARRRRRLARPRPELQELVEKLEVLGVEDGGAVQVVEALAVGADYFARALAEDGNAWERFKRGFDALRSGSGYVAPDALTVGGLVWVYLEGERFTAAVCDAMTQADLH